MSFPVFDLHCDTALALLGDKLDQAGSLAHNNGHWDIDRASTMPAFAMLALKSSMSSALTLSVQSNSKTPLPTDTGVLGMIRMTG